jgi:hypothetical protein
VCQRANRFAVAYIDLHRGDPVAIGFKAGRNCIHCFDVEIR